MLNERRIIFRKKILEEMVPDDIEILEENFDRAKKFIELTRDGNVIIKDKEKLNGVDQILLYLIGKTYAKEANLTSSNKANSMKLVEELKIPEGSVRPWVRELKAAQTVKQERRGKYMFYNIKTDQIGRILKNIERKTARR